MATRLEGAPQTEEAQSGRLQELAKRHLWMHFTRMGAYEDHELPIIVRGEGCYVWDEHGNKYLDGLSALFCVNAGHGRAELGEAAARQAKELGFYTNWTFAHPLAIELAARIANLAPGDLNRVFFTSGGSEAVESAIKLSRQYHRARGEAGRYKIVARQTAYHGTTMGGLIATAKGITSAYAPRGAVIASDKVFEPFSSGTSMFTHGLTFGGHPVSAAVAMANLDIFEQEDLCGRVREHEGEFRAMLEGLKKDLPIVGDVRGAGYFHAIELVKDKETKESFTDEESEQLLRGFLSGELYKRGLICRADDRGDPVIQFSPPLVAGPEEFAEIESVVRPVLTEAWERIVKH